MAPGSPQGLPPGVLTWKRGQARPPHVEGARLQTRHTHLPGCPRPYPVPPRQDHAHPRTHRREVENGQQGALSSSRGGCGPSARTSPQRPLSTPAQRSAGSSARKPLLHSGSRRGKRTRAQLCLPRPCPGVSPRPGPQLYTELRGHVGARGAVCLPSQPSLGLPGWM